jgi:trimeric autotransporter adhesin
MEVLESGPVSGRNAFRFRGCFGLLLVAILFLSSTGSAQTLVTGPIDDTRLITLRGNTHPLAQAIYDRGAVSAGFPAGRMMLVLKRSAEQERALQNYLQAAQNPASEQYHQYLTPTQFGQRYGLSEGDLETAGDWLRAEGFAVDRISSGRMAIEFSGTGGQVQSAFHTAIHSYVVNGEQHYANASDPEIPAALAEVVAGVTLNNFAPRSLNRSVGEARLDRGTGRAIPLFNVPAQNYVGCLNGYCYAVVPGDFATIYNTKPLLAAGIDGKGVTIGIVGVAPIDTSNVRRFREIFLPAYSDTNLPNVIVDGPVPTIYSSDDQTEAYLDVEEAGAVAPNATVNLYIAANSYVSNGLSLAIARALEDNQASVLSASFGECEAFLGATYNQFYNDLFEQAAAQGITVLVSTGDTGSAACDPPFNTSGPTEATSGLFVNGLASTPYDVAVGGTDFYYPANATASTLSTYWNTPTASNPNNNADWSSALSYIPEKPWNLSDPTLDQVDLSPSLGAGGGGASSCITYSGEVTAGLGANPALCGGGYAKPSWQTGFGKDTARDLPDVSLFASNGSNYSFTAICIDATECAVPNSGPNSVTAPVNVAGVGGTSVAAPSMAGIMALVVEKMQSRQGQANTVLYPLSQQTPQAFHDIAVGTNRVDCVAGTPDCGTDGYLLGYSATAGYDLATGIGSVDAAELVDNWSSVTFRSTTTTLSITPTTAVHGTALSFTVSVTGGATSSDISLLTTAPGASAQGQFTTTCAAFPCNFSYSALPGGSYSVTARYAGSSVYAPSTSNAVPVTITPGKSEVAIYYQYGTTATGYVTNLNGQTLLYGSGILFSAKPVPEGYALPTAESQITATPATGSVTVLDNGTAVGAPLGLDTTGQALFQNYSLSVGKHSLVVSYQGDASYGASNTTSPLATPMNFTIGPATSPLSLYPFYQLVLPGSGAAITATLPFRGPIGPTGTVTVSVTSPTGGTVVLPPAKLTLNTAANESTVTVKIPANALVAGPPTTSQAGNNIVTATYSGDTNYQPATQQTEAGIYDAQQYSNVYLFTTPNVPVAGQSTGITARVGWLNLASLSGYPGGSVTFLDGTKTLGTLTTTADAYGNGVATFTTSSLTAGTHALTANYSGDAQFLPSTASISVTVAAAPPPAEDFTLKASPISLAAGFDPSSTSALALRLSYASASANAISLSCSPPAAVPAMSCSVPGTVSFAAGTTSATSGATVSITGVTGNFQSKHSGGAGWFAAAGGLTLALLLPFSLRSRRSAWLGALLLMAFAAGLSSCNDVHWNSPTVAAGSYNVTVTGTLGATTHETTIAVTVQ